MSSSTGWDANRSRLPGTYGQAGHTGIPPAIILKSRAEVPLPYEPQGIWGMRTKGATGWPVTGSRLSCCPTCSPWFHIGLKCQITKLSVENGSGSECPHLMMGILTLPGGRGMQDRWPLSPASALGEHTHCCGWIVRSSRPRRDCETTFIGPRVAVKTHLQGSSR